MSIREDKREPLAEQQIDDLVIAEAEDDSAWEEPVRVRPSIGTSFSLPEDLAARAAFLARLHRINHLEEWLTRVIRERVELEELAFSRAKRELAVRGGS